METLVKVMLMAILMFPAFAKAQLQADESLALYLSFNEEEGDVARDQSQHANHGTIKGGTEWVDGQHGKALKFDGSIIGWGNNKFGQSTPPDGNDFVAISAGAFHNLALKADGSIVGWGQNQYGQATPPEGNDFIDIAAGWAHSLALKSDGSIVGWGAGTEN